MTFETSDQSDENTLPDQQTSPLFIAVVTAIGHLTVSCICGKLIKILLLSFFYENSALQLSPFRHAIFLYFGFMSIMEIYDCRRDICHKHYKQCFEILLLVELTLLRKESANFTEPSFARAPGRRKPKRVSCRGTISAQSGTHTVVETITRLVGNKRA